MIHRNQDSASQPWAERCCPLFLHHRVATSDLTELSTRLAALGHPIRLSLVSALSHSSGLTSSELTDQLARSQATVSHHTNLLSSLGLIFVERGGRCARWNVEHQQFALLSDALRF